MRRSALISGGVVAGALVLGAASPALAAGASAVGNAVASAVCDGTGPTASGPVSAGTGVGTAVGTAGRYGSVGRGPAAGAAAGGVQAGVGSTARGTGLATLPQGTLTAAQQSALQAMAEEEKLAHDVYVALAAKYPTATQFARIANSETQHLTTVRYLLTRYGLSDPTAGMAAGEFASAAVQDLYDEFSAAGSLDAAYADGQAIEKDDLAKLAAAAAGVTAPDVAQAYATLTAASQQHLAVFGG